PEALTRFRDDIAALRKRADFVVASNHWGLEQDVLAYQRVIAHAAIDAGADLVMGHGPHVPLPVEIYNDKPIFYGLGSFSFETGHWAMRHPDWIGMMVRLAVEDGALARAAFSFVRHNDANETIPRPLAAEREELETIKSLSSDYGTEFSEDGDDVVVWRKS
ncbi:MAG: CapA family protein, partial [Pseudomonadota bacterium]